MPQGQRVYVGNLAPDCRERDIEKFFKGYGKFGEVSMKQGYGFVDFEDYRDADDAVHDLNGKDMLGERVRIQLAHDKRERERNRRGFGGRRSPGRFGSRGFGSGVRRGVPPGRKTNHRIIVENLSSRTSWQDLKDFFRSAGDVNYCTAHKLRNGEGLVEFSERRGMEAALEKLDNTELHGKKLRLTEENKGDRGGSDRGRSRSRSPRRSRSRSPRKSTSRSRERSVPRKDREKSPTSRGSRSPAGRSSRSPVPRRSRSPVPRRSRSPVPRRSRSPNARRSSS